MLNARGVSLGSEELFVADDYSSNNFYGFLLHVHKDFCRSTHLQLTAKIRKNLLNSRFLCQFYDNL